MRIDLSQVRSSKTVIRAFDGARRDSVGEIDLPIEIGPIQFNAKFQVLDIPASYNLLLGRPWIDPRSPVI